MTGLCLSLSPADWAGEIHNHGIFDAGEWSLHAQSVAVESIERGPGIKIFSNLYIKKRCTVFSSKISLIHRCHTDVKEGKNLNFTNIRLRICPKTTMHSTHLHLYRTLLLRILKGKRKEK
jgi:hypothetical protein